MGYYVIQYESVETDIFVEDIPKKLKRKYQLLKGISRLKDWPDDVVFRFSNLRPEGMDLTDWVYNSLRLALMSDKFKRVVEEAGVPNCEYLSAAMSDHRGRPTNAPYWIWNFLVLTEAVDRQQSIFQVDVADEEKISRFERLMLRQDVLNDGPLAFRMKESPVLILVRADLAERIEAAALSGLKLVKTADYTTFGSL